METLYLGLGLSYLHNIRDLIREETVGILSEVIDNLLHHKHCFIFE